MTAAIVFAAVMAGGLMFAAGIAFMLWLVRLDAMDTASPAARNAQPTPPTGNGQQRASSNEGEDARENGLVERIQAEVAWLDRLGKDDLKNIVEFRGVEWDERQGDFRKRMIDTTARKRFDHGALRL